MGKAGSQITLADLRNTPAGKLAANAHLFEEKPKKLKRAKYNNSKIEWEGLLFDSQKEYRRYRELLLQLKAGVIGQLERQVEYELIPESGNERRCCYVADHRYMMANGDLVIEDVKSEATRKLPVYIMKRKLMLERYNIKIKEV